MNQVWRKESTRMVALTQVKNCTSHTHCMYLECIYYICGRIACPIVFAARHEDPLFAHLTSHNIASIHNQAPRNLCVQVLSELSKWERLVQKLTSGVIPIYELQTPRGQPSCQLVCRIFSTTAKWISYPEPGLSDSARNVKR